MTNSLEIDGISLDGKHLDFFLKNPAAFLATVDYVLSINAEEPQFIYQKLFFGVSGTGNEYVG
ncbi:MAG: hypothetical protein ACPG7R_06715 [Planctomycetota bacterium]